MKKKSKTFTNPFSDDFLQHWEIWKDFKKEEFNFEYRGVTSEQMAVKHLVDLSGGDEEKAIKILCQSVRRRWQGFWPLHETSTPNGKSNQSTGKEKGTAGNLRERVQRAVNTKFGNGKDSGSEPNLKAV